MKKRLFITTGSISLVNALIIIDMLKMNEEISEDTLAVLSFHQSPQFINFTKKIAGLHNFKQISFFNWEKQLKNEFKFQNFDEIYSVPLPKLFKNLNNHKSGYLFDEGPGYASFDMRKYKNLKGYYITTFLDKLRLIDTPKSIPVFEITKEAFFKKSAEIIALLGENEHIQTEKNILFIGHYIYRKLGDNVAIAFYKKYLDYFINKGYTVYFKGHPRDNDVILPILEKEYSGNEKFKLLENALPIEIYNYNFDLIVGAYSGTLVSIPHYRNIPAINLPFKELYHAPVGIGFKQYFALYDEYIPTFNDMEEVIGKSKEEIYQRYLQILDKKPNINNNEKLKRILMYKPNKFNDVVFGILALFVKDANKKARIKDMGRKSFFKMLEMK